MIITGFGTVETAVEAMKLGAFDFLTKPIPPEVVRLKVERALELCAARRGRAAAEAEDDVPARRAPTRKVRRARRRRREDGAVSPTVEKVAATDTTVFIAGESGTGKELVARAIHRPLASARTARSSRSTAARSTETLLESELFGHEKGAFTGAIKRKLGRFELADGGTLFLDEVGDIPPAMQVKLLRVLQEQRVRAGRRRGADQGRRARRVGDQQGPRGRGRGRPVPRGSRSTACTSCRCKLPPLRERREDIPLLVDALRRQARPRDQPARARRRRRGARPRSWPTTGRATCASSRTRSSRRWCSPRATRSTPARCRRSSTARRRGRRAGRAARDVAARDPRRPRAPADPQGLRRRPAG